MFSSHRRRHRLACLTLTAALAVLPAACGSGGDSAEGDEQVASLSSAAPAAAASATSSESRPLIRTDTSDEESDRMFADYGACLTKEGVPSKGSGKAPDNDDDPVLIAARKVCAGKEPEFLIDRVKRTDPAWPDKLRDLVTCIRAAGINAWEADNGVAYEKLPAEKDSDKVDACQDQVLGKG